MRGQAFKLPSAVGLFLATSISLARAGTDPLDLV